MSVCSIRGRARPDKGKERAVDVGEESEEALIAVPSLTKDDFVRLCPSELSHEYYIEYQAR